uniref:NADH-ubiquinone oxidoreductase chain 2 n=1 Tax=Loberonotha olivascens TaxID=1205664 RepID=A0A0S2MPZ2_9CUCU|nr:NADH deshydrogenase subunit 2 [Loberonotha olivascens]
MLNLYKILFFNSMIMGTLMAISSYSWLSMWMGLEINLLSIIPLLSSTKNIYPSESALKYFITQALASIILLFSIILSLNMYEYIPTNPSNFLMMMMNSALLTKMGAAPFHFWFPEVMEGLNWMNCLIMLTWQKIAPMILLMYNTKMILFLSIIIIVSSLVSGTMGLNQTSLRKILAYSSINHIGWMIASMFTFQTIWILYFIIYSVISINIIIIFSTLNIFFLKQLFSSMNNNKLVKILFIMNFLSLGGLPPFLGFLPKWLTVNFLIANNFMFLSFILIVSTLITLYFYLRITFSTLMINSNETLILTQKYNNFTIIAFNFTTLSGLLICTFLFNLF